MAMQLPAEKLNLLKSTLGYFLQAKKVSFKEIQSLLDYWTLPARYLHLAELFAGALLIQQ